MLNAAPNAGMVAGWVGAAQYQIDSANVPPALRLKVSCLVVLCALTARVQCPCNTC